MDINFYETALETNFSNLDEVVENIDELRNYLNSCLQLFRNNIYRGEGYIADNKLQIVNVKGIEAAISIVLDIDEKSATLLVATIDEKPFASCKLIYGSRPDLQEFEKKVNNYLTNNDMTLEDKLFSFNVYLPVPIYDIDQMVNIVNVLVETNNRIL